MKSLPNADKQKKEPEEERKNASGVPELRSPRTLTDKPFISQIAPEDVGLSRPSLRLQDNGNSMMSVAVDPVALVTTECITVTSALRKHARWAQSSVSAILGGASFTGSRETYQRPEHTRQSSGSRVADSRSVSLSNGVSGDDDSITSRWGLRGKKGRSMQDDPLLSAFARLRNDLRGCTGMYCRSKSVVQMLIEFRYQNI